MWWIFTRKEEDVERKLGLMNTNLALSFTNLKRDISTIKGWIEHFKTEETNNEMRFGRIESDILMLREDILGLKERSLREKPEQEFERVQSFNRSVQSFMNVQSLENLPKFGINQLERLTPAQKNLVALLLHAGGPLGYDEIAKKLGLNLVTVRRHLNDVLRVGVPIMAKMSVNTRRKMFYVSEDLKVSILHDRKKAKSEK